MRTSTRRTYAVYRYGIAAAFSLNLLSAGVHIAFAQERCEWSKVSAQVSIGANEVVTVSTNHVVREIKGRVLDATGSPISTAIVDVFRYKKSKGYSGLSVEDGDRIRSYHVDENGYFCLGDLPNGKFTLRFGTEVFAFKHLLIRVDKSGSGTGKPIEIRLDVGT